jgi:Zn ribbon nucleic-acid-binding protein
MNSSAFNVPPGSPSPRRPSRWKEGRVRKDRDLSACVHCGHALAVVERLDGAPASQPALGVRVAERFDMVSAFTQTSVAQSRFGNRRSGWEGGAACFPRYQRHIDRDLSACVHCGHALAVVERLDGAPASQPALGVRVAERFNMVSTFTQTSVAQSRFGNRRSDWEGGAQ